VHGTDHHLAMELARHHPVLWVDTPQSVWARWRRGIMSPPVEEVAPGITRLAVTGPPGITRPGVRELGIFLVARTVRHRLRDSGASPLAWIASTTEPVLAAVHPEGAPRVYLATDDFVAGAALWGMSPGYLHRARESNLGHSDLVLAVTSDLAEALRRGETMPVVFPNGCDLDQYEAIAETPPADGVRLTPPIAGVVGQFNERTDLVVLEAIQSRGISLLLVGPRYFASAEAAARFEALTQRSGVQWVDRVPAEQVVGYLRHLAVGLTPYADSTFNRRSYPLKTLDYLAAGLPVVTTDVAPRTGFDSRFVRAASTPEAFAELVAETARTSYDSSEIRESVAPFAWKHRADALLALIAGSRS
jgi:glycosyltransferase involved in cell wall biosynthesis